MLRNELYKPWFVGEKDWGFEILEGEFSGAVVQIQDLNFPKDDSPNLDVNYHIIHKPELIEKELFEGDMFKALFETIINDIIREAIENFKDEQDRNNNITKSDT